MAHKSRQKDYRFSFQSLIRLLIFLAIVAMIIFQISARKLRLDRKYDPTVLGEEISSSSGQILIQNLSNSAFQALPPKSQEFIKNIDRNPTYKTVLSNFENIKNDSGSFIQQQIKEIQKSLVKSLYENIIENIDSQ